MSNIKVHTSLDVSVAANPNPIPLTQQSGPANTDMGYRLET